MATPYARAGDAAAAEADRYALLKRSWRSWWSPSLVRDGPGWLQYLWTFLFNTAVAVVLSLIAWSFGQRPEPLQYLKVNWVIAQAIGFTIHVLFDVAAKLLGHARIEAFDTPRRVLFFGGLPAVGCVIGYWIGFTLLGVSVARMIEGTPRVGIAVIVVSIIVSTFWYRYMANKARLAEAQAARERERTRNVELERLALDAQLRSLQAQIEPHFLFNTLANVVSLIDAAPDKARGMLERLIDLLRASLVASRGDRTTLGQELALVTAYLGILRIRMGERLSYSIDVPAELAGARLPPLALQPLVENSIKHGIEPKVGGGRVALTARRVADAIEIEVADDGEGFPTGAAAGVGLANLRERLAAAYGQRAQLTIENLAPGTRVRLSIPVEA
jgi:hypothetical protein